MFNMLYILKHNLVLTHTHKIFVIDKQILLQNIISSSRLVITSTNKNGKFFSNLYKRH